METLVIVLGIVAAVGAVVWFVFARKHPENAAAHVGPSGATRYRGITSDRPAGPGAEAEAVVDRGTIAPGPMPQSSVRDEDARQPPWTAS